MRLVLVIFNMVIASSHRAVDRSHTAPYLWSMDAVSLTPERKAQLDDYAKRHGQDATSALDDLLAEALEWDQQEFEKSVTAIRRGYDHRTSAPRYS